MGEEAVERLREVAEMDIDDPGITEIHTRDARAILAALARAEQAEAERDALREALAEVHEYECGCARPGSLNRCVAQPVVVFAALSAGSGTLPSGERESK
jgi:hypothetical protein